MQTVIKLVGKNVTVLVTQKLESPGRHMVWVDTANGKSIDVEGMEAPLASKFAQVIFDRYEARDFDPLSQLTIPDEFLGYAREMFDAQLKGFRTNLSNMEMLDAAVSQIDVLPALSPRKQAFTGFSFRIDPVLKDRFTAVCAENGFAHSDVFRELISSFINQVERTKAALSEDPLPVDRSTEAE